MVLEFFEKDNFLPVQKENYNLPCVVVFGQIPDDLVGGKYIRNGPNPIISSHEDVKERIPSHWMDGHGHLHCVEFTGVDQANYTNVYVKTHLYKANVKKGID